MISLQPCSKCGGTPSVLNTKGIPVKYQIRCPNCQNSSPMCFSEGAAANAWNGRMRKSGGTKFVG